MPLYLCNVGVDKEEPWRSSVEVYLNPGGKCIRKVRHAEVVLVDDVSTLGDKYWLRLRWPGQKGGFAGYIAVYKDGSNGEANSTGNTKKEASSSTGA